MRKLSLIILAIVLLSFNTIFASEIEDTIPKDKLNEIENYLDENTAFYSETVDNLTSTKGNNITSKSINYDNSFVQYSIDESIYQSKKERLIDCKLNYKKYVINIAPNTYAYFSDGKDKIEFSGVGNYEDEKAIVNIKELYDVLNNNKIKYQQVIYVLIDEYFIQAALIETNQGEYIYPCGLLLDEFKLERKLYSTKDFLSIINNQPPRVSPEGTGGGGNMINETNNNVLLYIISGIIIVGVIGIVIFRKKTS